MSAERIRELLEELHRELEQSGEIDEETVAMVEELDEQIHRKIDPELPDGDAPVTDLAAALEARFATDYPVAEGVIRNLIDALGRMGI